MTRLEWGELSDLAVNNTVDSTAIWKYLVVGICAYGSLFQGFEASELASNLPGTMVA